jgi:hypothetical protein
MALLADMKIRVAVAVATTVVSELL